MSSGVDSKGVASSWLDRWGAEGAERYREHRLILSFEDYLAEVVAAPQIFLRSAAQLMLDAIRWHGVRAVGQGEARRSRYLIFDPHPEEGDEGVLGQEDAQQELVRAIEGFVREGRTQRLILLHGPNGSAKSSMVASLIRGLERYTRHDAGRVYRFHWVFPKRTPDHGRIGFGSSQPSRPAGSFAYLREDEIEVRLPCEHHENPLLLLPRAERQSLLESVHLPAEFVVADVLRYGELSQRSRQVFDALLASYEGDIAAVLRHVQVERFYVSGHYRRGAVSVEPQLRVDAGVRQITADRSLSALPAVLQTQTLFETYGPLSEGNRGIIEYNDLLKRPMEANKYLLATSEKGTVALETGILHLDALLLATANETYLEAFKEQPDWPSYKARMELVRMPYLLDFEQETQLYARWVERLRVRVPVDPSVAQVAALWAVLTRLRRPQGVDVEGAIRSVVQDMAPLQKALLYARGEVPPGVHGDHAIRLRAAVDAIRAAGAEQRAYEGRFGVSPREMKVLLVRVAEQAQACLGVPALLEALSRLVKETTVYEWLRMEPDGQYHRYERFVGDVRSWWLDGLLRQVRQASGLVEEREYQRVFERYITHAHHWLRGEKLDDPVSGASVPADERMLREVEVRLGWREAERDVRSRAISRVAAFRIDHPDAPVSYPEIFPQQFDALRESYYAEKARDIARLVRDALRWLDGDRAGLSEDQRRSVERMVDALTEQHGLAQAVQREALAVLFRERLRPLADAP